MADFSDSKNIIYGHNMRNGSMFHVLREVPESGFLSGKPGDLAFTMPDGSVQVYEIVGCEEVKAAGRGV